MARFRQLLALDVTHEFHAGAAVPGLRYIPTAQTAALMAREGLVLGVTAAGLELWQEQGERAPGDTWQLSFDVHASDALMRYYTAWPAQAYLPLVAGERGPLEVLRAVAQPAPPQAERQPGCEDAPLFWIDIACRPAPAALPSSGPLQPWRLALLSKKIHWKYFFSGALAARQLSIVDLDAAGAEAGLRFVASPWAATADGMAYLSEAPLPMQGIPCQRLQLREQGAAGKVLIRRLPNASLERLGRERGPNGQQMLVAEIYVHQ